MEQLKKELQKKRLAATGICILCFATFFACGVYFDIFKKTTSQTSTILNVVLFALLGGALIAGFTIAYYTVKLTLISKGKSKLYAKIQTYEDAVAVVKEASQSWYVLSALQFVGGVIVLSYYSMIIDCVVYIVFGFLLQKYKSRFCAVFLMLISVVGLVITALNMFKVTYFGGMNILLSLVMLYISARAIQATNLIHKLGKEKLDAREI